MRRKRSLPAIALLLAGSLAAHGQGKPRAPGPAAAPAQRVVLAPLSSLTEGAGKLAPLETLVAQSLGAVPGTAVVPMNEVHQAVKKARRPELGACSGETPCLAELGKLLGAPRVVAGEVGGLGAGQVLYLKVIDVASARETASTTAVLGEGSSDRRAEARAAAFRLLAPRQYQGTLSLKVDVPGAVVYLDGRKVESSPAPPLTLPVGTHALRVTHEQYRDWVRFVDVKFGETTALPVDLTAYPVISDEMRGRRERRPTGPILPLPWYRQWYTVAGVGATLFLGALVISYATSDGISSDAEITIDAVRAARP